MSLQQSENQTLQYETIAQLETLMSAWLSNFTSKRTTEAYARVLNSFLKFVQKFPQDVTQQDVIDYRHHLSDELKRANTTVNQHLYALRSFFNHLVKTGMITDSPADDVKATKVTPYGKTRSLDIKEDEHITLLKSIDTSVEMGARDYAIILLLLTTGLRVSAIANAKLKDIEQTGKRILLHYVNKGGKEATKQLTAETVQALQQYLAMRTVSETSPLFATIRGKSKNPKQRFGHAMSRVAISKMVSKRAKQAGVSTISAHSLRHTSAMYLHTDGFSVSAIQKHLGHSDKRTTLVYLDHLADDSEAEIVSAMDNMMRD